MAKKMLLLGLLALFTAPLAPAQEIDFDYFYEELAPYGEWLEVEPYGWVWTPLDVDTGWKPYAGGWWVYTDYGWTFESEEPWAWAVYHYGRWTFSDDYGWLWVPGTEWGPAWVAWRYDDDYVGWAPLPPAIGWSGAGGLVVGSFDFDSGLPWTCWIFVEVRWFAEPRLHVHILDPVWNRDYIHRTKVIVKYPYVNRRIFNPGYPVKDYERRHGRKIERHRVVETDRRRAGPPEKGRLPLYKPVVKKRHTVTPPDLPDKRKAVSAEEVRRKQEREKRQFDEYYERRKKEIEAPPQIDRRKKELITPPVTDRKEPARRREDPRKVQLFEDQKRLEEIRQKDKRVLENRQNRELEKMKKRPAR